MRAVLFGSATFLFEIRDTTTGNLLSLPDFDFVFLDM